MTLQALSLLQPWASLMTHLAPDGKPFKSIETRSWSTAYRGPIAIAASASFTRELREFTLEEVRWDPDKLPLGAILGVGLLTDIRRTSSVLHAPRVQRELAWGNYEDGRFAWLIDDMQIVSRPVPVKGKQGLWTVHPDDIAKLREQVRW